jgi:ParB family chromosome partitioning protein
MAKAKSTGSKRPRKKKVEASSRGLLPAQSVGDEPGSITALCSQIEADGGRVVGSWRDPVGGHWQVLAVLPLESVEPTPYQRDLSDSHVTRLTGVIDKLDRFLDPVIVVRGEHGGYWTPNGNHRRAALTLLGARSITALVVPERDLAFRILALNTEKAHNLREKSLEVIRMARALAALESGAESDYALQFEEPALITLGLCYEQRGRFAGGQYHPVLRRIDEFQAKKLPAALELRAERANQLLELDDAVAVAVAALKERGMDSPYLKAFVVARVNPIRFVKPGSARPDYDATIEKMLAGAKKFDPSKVKADQVARSGGPPEEAG